MKLDGEFLFDARIQDVWDALFDPQVLAAVLPGCEKLELVDGKYVGDIKVKVGPIQGKFTGKVDLLDKVEPVSYRMVIDGRGQQGFVNASANIALSAEGDQTRIRYTSESQIGGKIASVGQRLVETSAKAIVKQSLEGLNENIKLRVAAYAAHAASAAPAPVESLRSPDPANAAPVEPVNLAEPVAPAASPVAALVTSTAAAPAEGPVAALAASAPRPAAPAEGPVVAYKRADVGKLGAAVAKEVTKSLAPYVILAVLALAAILYFALR